MRARMTVDLNIFFGILCCGLPEVLLDDVVVSRREESIKAGAGPGIYVQEHEECSASLSLCRHRSETSWTP